MMHLSEFKGVDTCKVKLKFVFRVELKLFDESPYDFFESLETFLGCNQIVFSVMDPVIDCAGCWISDSGESNAVDT